jgi:hypothetical protein
MQSIEQKQVDAILSILLLGLLDLKSLKKNSVTFHFIDLLPFKIVISPLSLLIFLFILKLIFHGR